MIHVVHVPRSVLDQKIIVYVYVQYDNSVQQFRLNLSCNLLLEFAGWCNIWYLGRLPIGVSLDWVWCYIVLPPLQGIWQDSFIAIFSKQSARITKQGGWNNEFDSSSNETSCMTVASPSPTAGYS